MLKKVLFATLLSVSAAVVAHVSFSFVLGLQANTLFEYRAVNVRLLETGLAPESKLPISIPKRIVRRPDTIGAYQVHMDEKFSGDGKKNVLFAGSSVTYGYGVNAAASISGIFAQTAPWANVANAGLVGVGIQGVTEVICALSAARQKPDVVFLEVPVINELSSVLNNKGALDSNFYEVCQDTISPGTTADNSYFEFFLKRPWGVTSTAKLRPTFSEKDGSEILKNTLIPKTYQFTEQQVMDQADRFSENLRALFSTANLLDTKVIAYPSPIYLQAFKNVQLSGYLDAYNAIYQSVCEEYERIQCVASAPQLETDYSAFYNVTHVNRRGGAILARFLKEQAFGDEFSLAELPPLESSDGEAAMDRLPDDLPFIHLVGVNFAKDTAHGPRGHVVVHQPNGKAIRFVSADGYVVDKINYTANGDEVLFSRVIRYGDGRKQTNFNGYVEWDEKSWRLISEKGEDLVFSLEGDGIVVDSQKLSPVANTSLPVLTGERRPSDKDIVLVFPDFPIRNVLRQTFARVGADGTQKHVITFQIRGDKLVSKGSDTFRYDQIDYVIRDGKVHFTRLQKFADKRPTRKVEGWVSWTENGWTLTPDGQSKADMEFVIDGDFLNVRDHHIALQTDTGDPAQFTKAPGARLLGLKAVKADPSRVAISAGVPKFGKYSISKVLRQTYSRATSAGANGHVITFQTRDGKILSKASDGFRYDQVTYSSLDDVVSFKRVIRFADKRKNWQVEGNVTFSDDGWTLVRSDGSGPEMQFKVDDAGLSVRDHFIALETDNDQNQVLAKAPGAKIPSIWKN